jgi:hypothetical protein
MLQLQTPQVPSSGLQRVRCRQIVEGDFDKLINLLTRGFARHSRDYWVRGFSRWRHLPRVEGVPAFGYVLDGEIGLVGATLLISSLRGERIVSNLSSWYVEPAWRVHSPLLISVATRLRHVTYVAASPAPHTWRSLQTQGFKPYNFGRSTVFAWPGKGNVRDAIPAALPEAQLLNDHRDLGAISIVVERDGAVFPFVFRPVKRGRPAVRMMELIYCRDTADFRRCAPALAKHFLKSGVLGFLVDGQIDGMPSHYIDGEEPRYYKGPQPPVLNDHAYTRKTVFG